MIIKIPGIPKAKQSARFLAKDNKVRSYQSSEVTSYENWVKLQANQQRPKGFVMFDEPLIMYCRYIFPILSSHNKQQKEDIKKGIVVPKYTKPDVTDNLTKALADALSGIIYKDDALIWAYAGQKYYGEEPMTVIRIERACDFTLWEVLIEEGLKNKR